MRQIFISRAGPPEVLQLRESPDPSPGPGEVRVRVRAAGVNFADVMARLGLYADAPKLPCVVGYEVAGVIDEVGAGVERLKPGTRVLAMPHFGGYSDVVCVPEGQALEMPETMSFAEGAGLPVVYLTAHHMLHHLGNLRRGDTVLIHSAAGGVGLAALQLCKHAGATTLGTASPGKHAYLAKAGLDHAIDYRSLDFEVEVKRLTGGRGVDLALDAVGGSSLRKSYRCLAPAGRLFAFGAASIAPEGKRSLFAVVRGLLSMPIFWPIPLMNENRGVLGVNMGHLFGELPMLTRQLHSLLELYRIGAIRPVIDAQIPFAEAAEAHRRLAERRNVGKVVLVP